MHAALRAAARGWHVFPCRPRGKEPITARGHLDATTDEHTIREWWDRTPDANLGLHCEASGLVAVDLDGPDGIAYLAGAPVGVLPLTCTTVTARGGHMLYRVPVGRRGHRSATAIEPGVDVRCNGYIILPPSIHPSGHAYRWLVPPDAEGCPAVAPDWLHRAIEPDQPPTLPGRVVAADQDTPYGLAGLARHVEELSAAAEGTRNHVLNAAAFSVAQLVASGQLTTATARDSLLAAGLACGLGEREVRRTIRSGWRAGVQHPYEPPARITLAPPVRRPPLARPRCA